MQRSESRGQAQRAACRRRAKHLEPGFTLIEIMAVVLIIGLLSTIVGAAIFRQVDRARVTATRAQLSSLEGVLELYRMDNGKFPTSEQGLLALVETPTSEPVPRDYPAGGYLKDGRLPLDPWSEPYHYEMPGTNNPHAYDIWSFGADGAPGGEGVDADIGNWANEAGPTG